MNILYPSYYEQFHCIASSCKHNCCIGWEIDIDDITYEKYQKLEKDGQYPLTRTIEESEGFHFFKLCNERCPHLNNSNLCNIILEYGEDNLCQICRDHPRFVNEYSTLDEMGLGFTCEEATRLIMEEKKPNYPKVKIEDDEMDFFKERNFVFDLLENHDLSLPNKVDQLLKIYDIVDSFNLLDMKHFLSTLEILDPTWIQNIESIRSSGDSSYPTTVHMENFLLNFIFRHGYTLYLMGGMKLVIYASIYAMKVLVSMDQGENIMNTIRKFSSEIEYSEENTEKFFEYLQNKLEFVDILGYNKEKNSEV